jgi:hypothetical protein
LVQRTAFARRLGLPVGDDPPETVDIVTITAATPVHRWDTRPSMEVSLPACERNALVRRLSRMELASTALRKADYPTLTLRAFRQ